MTAEAEYFDGDEAGAAAQVLPEDEGADDHAGHRVHHEHGGPGGGDGPGVQGVLQQEEAQGTGDPDGVGLPMPEDVAPAAGDQGGGGLGQRGVVGEECSGGSAEGGGPPPAGTALGRHRQDDRGDDDDDRDHHPGVACPGCTFDVGRVGGGDETGQSDHDGHGTQDLGPADVAVEDDGQDGDEEEDLRGEDRLHHREVAEAQGRGLQPEGAQEQHEAEHPDPPLEGVGEQPQVHGVAGRRRFDPDPLQDPGHGAAQRGGRGEDVDHAQFYFGPGFIRCSSQVLDVRPRAKQGEG